MDIPTTRELELETSIRQKDSQISQLNDEVLHLRQYVKSLPTQPPNESMTIPPPLLSALLPRLEDASSASKSGSSSVTSALIQRTKLLQEENDELYEILKQSETGKLKEEVRALRRVVERLESALHESHDAIRNLSTELDKSYETILQNSKQPSRSPHNSYRQLPPSNTHLTNGSSKPPPTAPRAFKKPRLSDSRMSPKRSPSSHIRRQSPGVPTSNNRVKMEVDEGARSSSEHNDYERSRDRGREREREHERERGRDKDKDRRRSGGAMSRGGGGSASAHRRMDRGSLPSHSSYAKGDRTLAERMGL